MNKKAFVGLWADVFKGLISGIIIGIILMILLFKGIIPLPFEVCGLCS